MKNQAFTLIELLVVVLIIGILAAIALPQYQKAVLKSRYVQAKIIANAIATAEEEYFLANGKYTRNIEDLALGFNTTEITCEQDNRCDVKFPWGSCDVYASDANVAVTECRIDPYTSYMARYQNDTSSAGLKACVVNGTSLTTNDLRWKLCQNETGKTAPSAGGEGQTYAVFHY